MFKCKNVGAAKGSWEISNPKYIQSTNASKTRDSRPTVHSRNKKQLIFLFSKKHFPNNNNNNNNSSQLRCNVQFHSVILPRSVEATEPRTLRFDQEHPPGFSHCSHLLRSLPPGELNFFLRHCRSSTKPCGSQILLYVKRTRIDLQKTWVPSAIEQKTKCRNTNKHTNNQGTQV